MSAEGNIWTLGYELLVITTEREWKFHTQSRIDTGAENVQLDKIQITQIITNITTNHWKFLDEHAATVFTRKKKYINKNGEGGI